MRVGLVLPFSGDAPGMVALASEAQRLGFDGVFATDHMFALGHPDRPTLEPFTLLSSISVACPGLYVGTLVARVGLRAVGTLAKLAASLDGLSEGKAIIGLGSGDAASRAEDRSFGFPVAGDTATAGASLAETADALRALFRGEGWHGGHQTPAVSGPLASRPVRAGGPPVWLGGASEAIVAMAAEHADGWNGWGLDLDGFTSRARTLEGSGTEPTWAGIVTLGDDPDDTRARVEARRSHGLPEVWAGDVGDMRAFLEGLREAGATWAVFRLPLDRAAVLAGLLPEVRSWG